MGTFVSPAFTLYLSDISIPLGLVRGEKASRLNAAAINSAIEGARTQHGIRAKRSIVLPRGDFYIDSSIVLRQQFGLCIVGQPGGTRLLWNGPAGGTLMIIEGVRDAYFSGFHLIGDGTTIGLDYDAIAGGFVSTKNCFEQVTIENHTKGMRIGHSNFQVSETAYLACVFRENGLADVSIEDANAVHHNFY